jgi:hypothetical protein
MKFVLKGDPSLIKRTAGFSKQEYFDFWLHVAHCWDLYGLPDGKRNPTHLSPDGYHSTEVPSPETINASFNKILDEVLPESEKWLRHQAEFEEGHLSALVGHGRCNVLVTVHVFRGCGCVEMSEILEGWGHLVPEGIDHRLQETLRDLHGPLEVGSHLSPPKPVT